MSKLDMFDSDKQPTQNEAARWGNLLETIVATEWGKRYERQWIHIPVTIQSEEFPWMLANVDGFTLSDDRRMITGILEIKTTSAYNEDPSPSTICARQTGTVVSVTLSNTASHAW